MAAFVVVTSTPYAVVADKDGVFNLPAVPAGNYRITVWNIDRSRRSEQLVTIDAAMTELILDEMS